MRFRHCAGTDAGATRRQETIFRAGVYSWLPHRPRRAHGVTPARWAAFTILLRVERESAYAVELLHSGLLDDLSAADRNLATEIVMGVVRWRSLLDSAMAGFLNVPFK